MANYIHLTGDNIPTPSYTIIYKKQTNNFGGWSYAARPEAEDSKFYELKGEWFYVVKDKVELLSLVGNVMWNSSNPNELVSITDKDGIIKSIPMNNLVTTRVVDMVGLFRRRYSFNQYIINWDVSNVTDMREMFYGDRLITSSFNQPIGNWDVSNVTNMSAMFTYNNTFNQPIGNWAVLNVTNMTVMFMDSTKFNQDLSSWCVSGVTDHTNFDVGTTAWTLPKPNFDNPPC